MGKRVLWEVKRVVIVFVVVEIDCGEGGWWCSRILTGGEDTIGVVIEVVGVEVVVEGVVVVVGAVNVGGGGCAEIVYVDIGVVIVVVGEGGSDSRLGVGTAQCSRHGGGAIAFGTNPI